MATFADEVGEHPVIFSKFKVLDLDRYEFCSAQATAKKHRQNGVIAHVFQLFTTVGSKQPLALFSGQPVPDTNAQALRSFDPANASGEVGAEQPAVRSPRMQACGRQRV